MRYLVLSDIHSNIDAFNSVLSFFKRKKFNKILFLGDLVGYAAAPNQVVEKFRSLKGTYYVRGNHDKVCSGIEKGSHFNDKAKAAALWTMKKLTKNNLNFLKRMPQGPLEVNEEIVIAHGSPINEDFYVFSDFDAYQIFMQTKHFITFIGHTHLPIVYEFDGEDVNGFLLRDRMVIKLDRNKRYIINPGSVGQPRDRDPRSSAIIYDDKLNKIYAYRINYNINRAFDRIVRERLPIHLAIRLGYGV